LYSDTYPLFTKAKLEESIKVEKKSRKTQKKKGSEAAPLRHYFASFWGELVIVAYLLYESSVNELSETASNSEHGHSSGS